MLLKRCAVCKRPSFTSGPGGTGRKWICPSCQEKFEQSVLAGKERQGGKICRKCKKLGSKGCRFSETERRKITACSDWESKNAEREKRRWAKYEVEED